MKKLFAITIFLTLFLPVLALGNEAAEVPGGQAELKAQNGSELTNGELSEITGLGLRVSFIEAERESVKIIFWDEARGTTATINFSSGYGNSQKNTLSIQR